MKFGILIVKDSFGKLIDGLLVRSNKFNQFFSTDNLDEARKEKKGFQKKYPNCEYQIVEFESKKKLYGIIITEGIDNSMNTRGSSWFDKFVHLQADKMALETIYLSTDLNLVKINQKQQQDYCYKNYDNRYKYVVWDVDLDQELYEPIPHLKENKLIKWLMN